MLNNYIEVIYRDEKTEVHVSEMQTFDALRIFSTSESILITEFIAEIFGRPGLFTQDDLPKDLHTVGAVVDFLVKNNENVGLIDFSATIGDGDILYTHDDGAFVAFTFLNKTKALECLRHLTKDDSDCEWFLTVLKNPGKWILFDNRTVKKIFTTDEEIEQYKFLKQSAPSHIN
jgi:hypothetical protein